MKGPASILAAALLAALLSSCAGTAGPRRAPAIQLSSPAVEVGGRISASLDLALPGGPPSIRWESSAGTIHETAVMNEIDLEAPGLPGTVELRAVVRLGSGEQVAAAKLEVLPPGALAKTATVVVEVDSGSLRGVWVDEAHPAEDFAPPLRIKGTFRMDEDTGEAFSGGSWPNYVMYDDGTHGDRVAGDGIWTIKMVFEKTRTKVYFAFDDANPYRVGFESGLALRLKLAWRGVDEAGEVSDANNLYFVPDRDQVVSWTAAMAEAARIRAKPAK